MPLSEVQKQLAKFEQAGIVVSRMVGSARMYTWNPRDRALESLRSLLRRKPWKTAFPRQR